MDTYLEVPGDMDHMLAKLKNDLESKHYSTRNTVSSETSSMLIAVSDSMDFESLTVLIYQKENRMMVLHVNTARAGLGRSRYFYSPAFNLVMSNCAVKKMNEIDV